MAADGPYVNKESQSLMRKESSSDALNDQSREKHYKANGTILINDPAQNKNKRVYGDKVQKEAIEEKNANIATIPNQNRAHKGKKNSKRTTTKSDNI